MALGVGQVDDFGFGLLILELNLVTDQSDNVRGGRVGAGGNHFQPHFGPFWSAYELDRFGEIHIHHVNKGLLALSDSDNAIVFLDLLAVNGRSTAK